MKQQPMKAQDALNILNISDFIITKEIVKRAYIECCAKYHPDHNGQAGLEMMKMINVAYSALKKLLRSDFFDTFRNAKQRNAKQRSEQRSEQRKEKAQAEHESSSESHSSSSESHSSSSDDDDQDCSYDFGAEIFAALKFIFCLDTTDLIVELCGNWIWLSGKTYPIRKILNSFTYEGNKFRWCSKKKAWSYSPEEWQSKNRDPWSMDHIRATHGSREFRRKSA